MGAIIRHPEGKFKYFRVRMSVKSEMSYDKSGPRITG